ncbi:MAG: class II fructose-bisphosphate aldolase [Spirochaetota bacterium]
MALFSMQAMLRKAKNEKYALGYFESWNLESTRAVINAAEEMRSPVIIGFNGGILTDKKRILKSEDFEILGGIGRTLAQKAKVPVAFILNEIQSLKLAVEAIKYGFNALMFESETDNLDEHIKKIMQIVEIAHAVEVAVESNIGILPSADNRGNYQMDNGNQFLTRVEDAQRFVEQTGVDALGVSIGNVEVLMNGKAQLDFNLLEKINTAASIPITLHGGSGIADEDIKRLIERGVCKMNLGAALNQAFLNGMGAAMQKTLGRVSPKYVIGSGLDIDILAHGENSMKELVKDKIRVYGSAGKA